MSQNDAKEIDIESTCGGNEQQNLQLQVHTQLQRNPLSWYGNDILSIIVSISRVVLLEVSVLE